MVKIFLSYARIDGTQSSGRLSSELRQAGFIVWRDLENLEGGQAWKDQLRNALRLVDTVLVLLTPHSVESPFVRWEWEQAFTLRKRVIPILILPCRVPDELSRLHYHDFRDPANYSIGFASLIRDLNQIKDSLAEPNFEL